MTTPNALQPTPSGKVILSGIQPSGTLHIGNYLGALKQWVALQADNETFYCIVDEHAITVPYDPSSLQDKILDAAALYLAAGLDPEKSVIFVQSHVPAHTELAWLLSTITPYGELTRMTQLKDKVNKIKTKMGDAIVETGKEMGFKNIDETLAYLKEQPEITRGFLEKIQPTLGLFAYPVLMAADILLYQTHAVPVGEDQIQHIELTRTVAERFNKRFGEIFTVPHAYVPSATARIMSLSDPSKKMSKSDEAKSYIALADDADTIRKKIRGAVTETDAIYSFTQSGPAVKNLLAIYQAFSEEPAEAIEAKFANKGYQKFKDALADLIIAQLTPLQEKYRAIRANDDELRIVLGRGNHKAAQVATQTLTRVKEAMGLL